MFRVVDYVSWRGVHTSMRVCMALINVLWALRRGAKVYMPGHFAGVIRVCVQVSIGVMEAHTYHITCGDLCSEHVCRAGACKGRGCACAGFVGVHGSVPRCGYNCIVCESACREVHGTLTRSEKLNNASQVSSCLPWPLSETLPQLWP